MQSLRKPMDTVIAKSRENLMNKKISKKWKTGIIFFLLVGFLMSMTFIQLPYFAFKPGTVNELSRRIVVSEGRSFEPSGEIHFTTISQDSSINGWEFLEGTFKESIHLIDEDSILGTRNRDENQTFNFDLMRASKSTAVSVALSHLGLEPYKATGVGVASVGGPSEGLLTTSDVIISVDKKKVFTDQDLIFEIRERKPSEIIQLDVEKIDGSDPREISIELGSREDQPSVAFLGIAPQTRIEDNEDLDRDGDGWMNIIEIDCNSDPDNIEEKPKDLDNDTICDTLDEDIDGDELPNDWEVQRGLDPMDNNDTIICHGLSKYCLRNYDDFTFP